MYTRWKLSVCACVLAFAASSVSMATAQGIYHWDRTSQSSEAGSTTEAQVEPGGTYDNDTDSSSTPSSDLVSSSTSSSSSGAGGSTSADAEGECELNTDGQAILKWEFDHEVSADISLTTWASGSATGHQETETDAYATLDHPSPPPGQTNARLYVDIQWDADTTNFLLSRDMNIGIRIGNGFLSLYVNNSGYVVAEGYKSDFTWFSKQSTMTVNSEDGRFKIELDEFVEPVSVGSYAYIVCQDPVESSISNLINTAAETWSHSGTDHFWGTIEVRVDN